MAIDSTKSIQENYNKYAQYFEDSSSSMASTDTFYKLLLAEMSNQDPLEPTSNSEFVAQMASFSSLQNQTDSLKYQQQTYAGSLAGKTVTVATNNGTSLDVKTGVVTAVDFSDENNIVLTVDGKQYSLSNVMAVSNTTASTNTSAYSDGAYATSLIGKTVTASTTNSSGAAVIEKGVVDSIEIENGTFRAIINGLAYELSAIVKVENTAAKSDETSETESAEKTEEVVETKPVETDKTETADEEKSTDEDLLELFS